MGLFKVGSAYEKEISPGVVKLTVTELKPFHSNWSLSCDRANEYAITSKDPDAKNTWFRYPQIITVKLM